MTAAPGGGWWVERRADTARVLHGDWPAPHERRRRLVGLCSVLGPRAVVLGSTQSNEAVSVARARRAGVDVVRRGSGGGAVSVAPGAQVWVEVWLPRDDPLWDDDVIRSSWWLGEAWKQALEGLGAPALLVHRGGMVRTAWSDVVCFAGVGPGEVTLGGAKVVGVAQRRTRQGARLHSMAPMTWEPASLTGVLDLDDARARRAREALEDVAAGIGPLLPPLAGLDPEIAVAVVEDALINSLP